MMAIHPMYRHFIFIINISYMIILKKKHKNSIINIIKGTSTTNENDCQLIELNKTITENGNYTYTPIGDIIGYSKVNINVDVPIPTFETETKDITITENGTTTVTPSSGYDGLESVSITTDVKPNLFSFEEELTTNGEYSYSVNSPYDGFGNFKINVNVQPTLQTLNYNVNSNGEYDIIPTDGYNAIGSVKLNVNVPTIQYDFSGLGYTSNDTSIIDQNILDNIVYGEQIQSEYTDRKKYYNDKKLVYFPFVNTSNRTSFLEMFGDCGGLQYVPPLTISNKCTNLIHMFYKCGSLKSIDTTNWDTSNVTDFTSMFRECTTLENVIGVENFNTSNVTNMFQMFYGCNALTQLDLSNWNTSNVTNMFQMFYGCNALTQLDLSNWNTSKVTDMSYMFYDCNKLTEIIGVENLDTSNVTTMEDMFNQCNALNQLDLSNWNTSNVTDMSYMFYDCFKLADLNLSGWDVSNVTHLGLAFGYMYDLTNFQAPQNINEDFTISWSSKLTVDSLLSILNNLTDRTGKASLECHLGATNLAKLSDEQKAIATSKNWILD